MGVSGFDLQWAIGLSDLPTTERHVVRTMLTFADTSQWTLWASNATLAQHMGCHKRTVQNALKGLHTAGLIAHVGTHPSGTNEWQIAADEFVRRWPRPKRKRSKGGVAESRPPDAPESQGDGGAPSGGWSSATQTTHLTNQRTNHSTAADAFVSLVGSDELLTHPNATPERIGWVVKEAPSKRNPGGWAAGAIREGYQAPPKSPETVQAEKRERREAALDRYQSLPDEERRQLWERARALYPSLDPTDPMQKAGLMGAVAKLMGDES